MKYEILIDYGLEGWKFWSDDSYNTVAEAVKEATANSYGNPFLIIQIVNWKTKKINRLKGDK